jgi:hypothetical protein
MKVKSLQSFELGQGPVQIVTTEGFVSVNLIYVGHVLIFFYICFRSQSSIELTS